MCSAAPVSARPAMAGELSYIGSRAGLASDLLSVLVARAGRTICPSDPAARRISPGAPSGLVR